MTSDIRFLSIKEQDSVTREWDTLAPLRDRQIATGADASFSEVLEPWILDRVEGAESVVDIGCGTGRLTASIKSKTDSVLGIDPSGKSIEVAEAHDSESEYAVATAEAWVENNPQARFDVAVANMVLMDVLDLAAVCSAVASLARGHRVLATITHPCFWPTYWGYVGHVGFDYNSELIVEAPFKTSDVDYALPATHVHRPISTYLEVFRESNIQVTALHELRGPEPKSSFPFPRFFAVEASVPA